jgi:hypothetical protein
MFSVISNVVLNSNFTIPGVIPSVDVVSAVLDVVNRPVEYLLEVMKLANALLPSLPARRSEESAAIWNFNSASGNVAPIVMSAAQKQAEENRIVSDAARFALLEKKPELMVSYLNILVPVFIGVFGATAMPSVRRKAVECVCQGLWYASGGLVDGSIRDGEENVELCVKGIAKFVSDVLSSRRDAFPPSSGESVKNDTERREAVVIVTGGILLCEILLRDCDADKVVLFSREGVFSELDLIAADVVASGCWVEDLQKVAAMKIDEKEKSKEVVVAAPVADEESTDEIDDLNEIKNLLKKAEQFGFSADGGVASSSATTGGGASADASRALLSRMGQALERLSNRGGSGGESRRPTGNNVLALSGESYNEIDLLKWVLFHAEEISARALNLGDFEGGDESDGVLKGVEGIAKELGRGGEDEIGMLKQLAGVIVGSGGVGLTGYIFGN